eukprot:6305280-Pyramimonas_sp.AAC.1
MMARMRHQRALPMWAGAARLEGVSRGAVLWRRASNPAGAGGERPRRAPEGVVPLLHLGTELTLTWG